MNILNIANAILVILALILRDLQRPLISILDRFIYVFNHISITVTKMLSLLGAYAFFGNLRVELG